MHLVSAVTEVIASQMWPPLLTFNIKNFKEVIKIKQDFLNLTMGKGLVVEGAAFVLQTSV